MNSTGHGPLTLKEQSLFVVLCVLLFVRLDCTCILMRSAAAHTHPSTRSWTSRDTSPVGPEIQATFLAENLPLRDPLNFSPVLVFHQRPISLVYCANDKLVCLIITALSPDCRGRSGAVCVGVLRGRAVENSPLRVKSQPFSFRERH